MISLTVTVFLKKKLRNIYRFYRLFYNHIAFITLIPLIRYSSNIKSPVIFSWDGPLIIVQLFFLTIAFLLFITGGRKYDMLQFLGIRQLKSEISSPTISKTGKLDTSGILGITRHPWYMGAIIFIWVVNKNLYIKTLIVNIILTLYLITGTILEEKKLLVDNEDDYRDYQNKVSMLFPFKWIKSKISKKS